jgi:hypothetical protein
MKKILPLCAAAALLASSQAVFALESVTSKFKIGVYGWVKTDAIYENHLMSSNEYLTYTQNVGHQKQDFRLSARASRLGFDIDAGDGVTAKLEGDLLGAVTTTSASPRVRHAFVQYQNGPLSLLAGQTWHLTPLELPDVANDFFMGYAGCLWMRVPQLRASYAFTDAFKGSFAFSRPSINQSDDEGTGSGLPDVEASVEAKLAPAVLTLSGALGKIRNTSGNYETGRVELVDFGFHVPAGMLTFNGQVWTGRNLANFLGGIGNKGYGPNAVRASGGFLDARVQPLPELWFNGVAGIDDPQDGHLASGSPSKNRTILANANYLFAKKILWVFEAAYNVTDWKYSDYEDKRSGMHYQLSAKLVF